MHINSNYKNLRFLLINPFLHPVDLRGELQTSDQEKKHEISINFGLLVIASILIRYGVIVEIIDLERNEKSWKDLISNKIHKFSPHIIGIGSISVYSFLPTIQILNYCKNISEDIVTVLGGQNSQNFPLLLPEKNLSLILDYLICGNGEEAILEICNHFLYNRKISLPGITVLKHKELMNGLFTPRVNLNESNSFLEYELYPNYLNMWPVIEESRGCPFSCDFCANSIQGGPKINYKEPKILLAETKRLFKIYKEQFSLPTVLMTSIFGVNPNITFEYFNFLKKENITPRFLAATRVDLNIRSYIDLISNYFDQMHFGLETGSLKIIKNMFKSKKPDAYLKHASSTFEEFHSRNIHTAVNFIIGYLGETKDSISESIKFLQDNYINIDSVWGGVLVAYPDSPFHKSISLYNKLYGSSLETISPYCKILKTFPINPSSSLNYYDALKYSEEIHRLFYNADTFYHHYKWYVGPKNENGKIEFFDKDEFFKLFSPQFLENDNYSNNRIITDHLFSILNELRSEISDEFHRTLTL